MLTDDELIVLEIAAQSGSILAIGRWEKPAKHLTELGCMKQLDQLNYGITDAGRVALEKEEAKVDAELMLKASVPPQAAVQPPDVPSDAHKAFPEHQTLADADISEVQSQGHESQDHEALGEDAG